MMEQEERAKRDAENKELVEQITVALREGADMLEDAALDAEEGEDWLAIAAVLQEMSVVLFGMSQKVGLSYAIEMYEERERKARLN